LFAGQNSWEEEKLGLTAGEVEVEEVRDVPTGGPTLGAIIFTILTVNFLTRRKDGTYGYPVEWKVGTVART
jgi:hypothetical protein